jgi:biopolymer transport protein ExbB
MRTNLILAFALLSAPAFAQDEPKAAPAPAPAAPAAAPAPKVDLAEAYKKEFAFLSAQKRDLSARLAATRGELERDRARLEGEVTALENQVAATRGEADELTDQMAQSEREAESNAANSELLLATFEQAQASLAGIKVDLVQDEAYVAATDAAKLERLYSEGQRKLVEFSRVRTEPGKYFLPNGNQVDGNIVYVGNVAAYGVSPQGSGVLAPAGAGQFKLWSVPSTEVAEALAKGANPPTLKVYLYETLGAAASEPQVKTFWGEMQKGGAIGYVILLLGALALGAAILRAFFLRNAGARVDRIMDRTGPLVKQHRIAEAIDGCKQDKGSAARVITATLRNIGREREHLEDIISESILHESSHLNRFGTFITMIAAVAPLLGLLGTVTGMIQTFDVITEFGTSDPKLLSGGIAIALVTTEQGLMVAIPCLLIGNLLNGWAESIKDDMEKAALKIINLYQDGRQMLLKAA